MKSTLEAMMKVVAQVPVDLEADVDVEGGLCKISGSCAVTCGTTCTGTCPNTGA